MVTYRVPVVIKGYAIVQFPQGKGSGDYVGGLPRDAEFEVLNTAPFLCGHRMEEFAIELSGQAAIVEEDPDAASARSPGRP
jgi:hypothetical protein